ncbi:MAG: hypothetical protein HY202_09300 [Nitrospirae bacterium]|nr:hypothetical protein [Nitrospirota bacterium]MBI3606202.1 hypothetical protein [Nitrospirota bacterium]
MEEILKKAEEEACERVNQAKEQAFRILSEKRREVEAECARQFEKEEKEAEQAAAKIIASARKMAEGLKERGEIRLEEGSSLILKRVFPDLPEKVPG